MLPVYVLVEVGGGCDVTCVCVSGGGWSGVMVPVCRDGRGCDWYLCVRVSGGEGVV